MYSVTFYSTLDIYLEAHITQYCIPTIRKLYDLILFDPQFTLFLKPISV